HGQRVVDPQADVDVGEGRLLAFVDGDQERDGAYEVRRPPHLQRALVGALEDQAELAVLEVAEAAVDELGGLRGGPRPEVTLLDQHDAEAAVGRVAGDAGAGDAAADDHHVEGMLRCHLTTSSGLSWMKSSSSCLRATPPGASVMRSVPFCVLGK